MKNNTYLKVSRYTFLIKDNQKFYIYNSLSNALLEVDEELYELLFSCKKNNTFINESLNNSIASLLKDSHFITENDEDLFLIYKSLLTSIRNERQSAIITIAPTMDCCFNCHYCFEKSKRPSYMSEDVMIGITKFIGKIENLKLLKLTWFGGEPLMAVPEMERLYRKLRRKLKNTTFHSNIITTAFHLTEENIKALQRMKVSEMQITLDGMKDTHNKIKFTEGCNDTFSQVISNIDRICNIAPEIHIVIRTNITKSNAHEYNELQNFIFNRFEGMNIAIAPAFVMDRSDCGKVHNTNLFTTKEYPEYILELAAKGIDSQHVRYPHNQITECAIRNPYSLSFDPEGNVYKCWEHIGDTKYSIGKITKNGQIENINNTLLNRQLYGADPLEDPRCRQCPYLPICTGGCPIQRIENSFHEGQNDHCTYYKGHIDEFILNHIRKLEAMSSNR